MHSSAPGERAKVIYWYRTAPGLRLGRPALDDGAMRTLEEQYPDIDFDWPYILDVASMTPVEVEAQLPVRKRKPQPRQADDDMDGDGDGLTEPAASTRNGPGVSDQAAAATASTGAVHPSAPAAAFDLLSELLGRGIASSLRARHGELAAGVAASSADAAVKATWHARLAAIDPDSWTSPELVMAGIASVEGDADVLQDAIDGVDAP